MRRGQTIVYRVGSDSEFDESRLAPVMEIDLRPHPTRDLGPEYDHEVGCQVCTRVGTRPAWERAGWYCPFDLCPGDKEDVITAADALALRKERNSKGISAPIIKHGTVARYASGCACAACLEAAKRA